MSRSTSSPACTVSLWCLSATCLGHDAILVLDSMATDDQDRLTDYSADGVDLTLIRWMLSLTPAERLEYLEQRVNDIISIRELNART
jgi:hypothetical protein